MTPLEKSLMALLEQVLKGGLEMPDAERHEKISKLTDAQMAEGLVSALAIAISVVKLPKPEVLELATRIVADLRAAERFKYEQQAKQEKGKAVTAGLADALAGADLK